MSALSMSVITQDYVNGSSPYCNKTFDHIIARDIDFSAIDIAGCSFSHSEFVRCVFRGCDMTECRMDMSEFNSCDLSGARLEKVSARRSVFLVCEIESAYAEGSDFSATQFNSCNMDSCDMNNAILHGVQFCRCNTRGMHLNGSDMTGANIDYSAWPMWCGSYGVKVDRRLFEQLVMHLCGVVVDDREYWNVQQTLKSIAMRHPRAQEFLCLREDDENDKD